MRHRLAEKAQVVGTTVSDAVVNRSCYSIRIQTRDLNNLLGTTYGTLEDAEESHRPGRQQDSLATSRANLAAATAMDSDGTPSDIATATGYQADGTDTVASVTDAHAR